MVLAIIAILGALGIGTILYLRGDFNSVLGGITPGSTVDIDVDVDEEDLEDLDPTVQTSKIRILRVPERRRFRDRHGRITIIPAPSSIKRRKKSKKRRKFHRPIPRHPFSHTHPPGDPFLHAHPNNPTHSHENPEVTRVHSHRV